MEKIKEFIKEHKTELMLTGALFIGYKIGHKVTTKVYKSAIHHTFSYMDKYGYNVYKIILKEGAKNV